MNVSHLDTNNSIIAPGFYKEMHGRIKIKKRVSVSVYNFLTVLDELKSVPDKIIDKLICVAGLSVKIYTAGGYTTQDI